MTATDTEIANESVDLLSQLIRNECVNDGTPESGFESRSADLLADYLEGNGVGIETFESHPGRTSRVARTQGPDPATPTRCLLGHTPLMPAHPTGRQQAPVAGECPPR